MNKFTITALILLLTQSALATSLHPCTPTRPMKPTNIACRTEDGSTIKIVVRTLASPPIPMCIGTNYVEYQTAEVWVTDNSGHPVSKADLLQSEFSYESSASGDATFQSPKLGLDLKNCVIPKHGAVSFGN